MRCRDFFVHLYKDATGDYWEFDSATWEGVAAEPLRWRIRAERTGATLMSGCLDVDTEQVVWTDVETEGNLQLAMANVVDRVFSEAGGMHRDGMDGDGADADGSEYFGVDVDVGEGTGGEEWMRTFDARAVS